MIEVTLISPDKSGKRKPLSSFLKYPGQIEGTASRELKAVVVYHVGTIKGIKSFR